MSYQTNDIEGEQFAATVVDQSPKKRSWASVYLISALGGLALMAVTVTQRQSQSNKPFVQQQLVQVHARGSYDTLTEDDKSSLFEEFKTKYEKTYSDEEAEQRYENFKAFLAIIDERNAAESENGAVHGITKFADLTQDEFESQYLGYKPSESSSRVINKGTVEKYTGSSTYQNWAGVYTTPVKNQGYCGSCWAFSATEQIESDGIRAGILTTTDYLSPQQIVSCDTDVFGCDGGDPESAYEYVTSTGGLEKSSTYPYTSYYGSTGTCTVDSSDFVITVVNYTELETEDEMQDYVLSTGPLSICVAASTWSSYSSGIITTCDTVVDHCVQAVGIDTDNDYWIVRNSWGTNWGVKGYIYVKSGINLCKITNDPIYTSVAAV